MNRFTIQLDEIKAAFAAEPNPTIEVRLDRIARIEKMVEANEEKICKALEADFGVRHPVETRLAECQMIYQACKYTRKLRFSLCGDCVAFCWAQEALCLCLCLF